MPETSVTKTPAETLKDRFTNRLYLTAVSAFAFKVYNGLALKYGWPAVNVGDWNLAVDLIAYALIGAGIHSTFKK